jgi:diguanylate cyclase (GGDEF)-like protein
LNRSSRYNHKLALVMLDLHRFKEVNDRFGHQQGDTLLQMAAATFRKSLRTSDYAFRIGGDEFALLLPQSDTEQAATLSRRLRATYASSLEPMNLGIPLALDYGLAVYPDDGELQATLIRVADERLYVLKNGTRSAGSSGSRAGAAESNSAFAPVVTLPNLAYAEPPEGSETKKTVDRRRWQRFSMSDTNAYALVGENPQRKARVLDLGHGGLCLETSSAEEFGEAFHAVLHVPILPPVRVNLRRIYRLNLMQAEASTSRIGCSFVT